METVIVLTLTVYQKALADLGHVFTQTVDGSWDVEANPERAGEYGEITEADHRLAEEAVRKAYAAGERSARVLGVVFHPDTDRILPQSTELPPVPGQWSVY